MFILIMGMLGGWSRYMIYFYAGIDISYWVRLCCVLLVDQVVDFFFFSSLV